MDFNPFEFFRKRIKTFFAALVLLCMFTFVLSSGLGGGGDFVAFFQSLFEETGAGSADEARLYGEAVSTRELESVRVKRLLANQYMGGSQDGNRFGPGVIQFAIFQLLQQVQGSAKDLEPLEQQQVQRLAGELSAWLNYGEEYSPALARRLAEEAEAAQARAMSGELEFQQAFQLMQMAGTYRSLGERSPGALADQIERRLASLKGDEKAADAYRTLLPLARYLAGRLPEVWKDPNNPDSTAANRNFGPTVYFTAVPYTEQAPDRESLLEFILLLRKADQLGMRVGPEQAKQFVKRDTFGVLGSEAGRKFSASIEQQLLGGRGYSVDVLLEALADEFTVRLVYDALMGGGEAGRVSHVTPYELSQFRDQRETPADFGLLRVKVSDFAGQVDGSGATDAELRKLYQQYRRQEPDPAKAEPGFMEPRRIGVGYLRATFGEGGYYSAEARKSLARSAVSLAAGPAGGTLAAVGALAPKAQTGPLAEPLLTGRRYGRYLEGQRVTGIPPGGLFEAPATSPAALASSVGQVAGSFASGAGPLAAAGSPTVASVRADIQARSAYGIQQLTHPHGPAGPLVAAAPVIAATPAVLPERAVAYRLAREILSDLTAELFYDDLDQFSKAFPKKAEGVGGDDAAQRYLRSYARERGFSTGQTDRPRTKAEFAADPNLEPLAGELRRVPPAVLTRKRPELGDAFFAGDRTTRGRYEPRWFPRPVLSARQLEPGRDYFLAWETADEAARIREYKDAEPLVRAAWVEQKARDLARKHAEGLAGRLKAAEGSSDQPEKPMRDLAADPAAKAEYFDFGAVSLLEKKSSRGPGMAGPPWYEPTEVPEYLTEHPGREFVPGLLKLSQIGETAVLPDAPKDNYFVARLVGRRPLPLFNQEFSRAASGADPLLNGYAVPHFSREFRDEVMRQLKAEAEFEDFGDRRESERRRR